MKQTNKPLEKKGQNYKECSECIEREKCRKNMTLEDANECPDYVKITA